MPSSKNAVKQRCSPRGHGVSAQPMSSLRRWINRILLLSGALLVSAGLYQGGATMEAQQVARLTVRGDVRHLDSDAIQVRLAPKHNGSLELTGKLTHRSPVSVVS